MEIADLFPTASFAGLEFPYTAIEIHGALDHHVHKYIHRPGGEVESLGRHLYEVSFSCVFDTGSRKWRNLYPQRLAELISFFEDERTADLIIPNRGIRAMKAKAIKWDTNFTAKIRSGESVKFTFLEDGTDKFSAYAIVNFAAADLYTQAIVVRDMAVLVGKPNLFDDLLAAVQRFNEVRDKAELYAYQVAVMIQTVLDVCAAIERLATLQDVTNWTLYEAFQDLYNSALLIAQDTSGANRVVDSVMISRPMSVVDVSMDIYGDPGQVSGLLEVNNFQNAMRIPAGTIVNYFVI